ncbi:MAG: hypothetical protein C4516_04700 [Oxalobacter sp.]|nr:MAG: hypothetical protein C4516_04700 [Oxalobacter sp.]
MNANFSDFFCRLVACLKMADFEFAKQSPDCQHEIWLYYSTFISVPRQCKSRHTANAILRAADFPREY